MEVQKKKINLNFELHTGQLEVYKNAGRFTAVNCGRRWGKTLLAECLLLEKAIRDNQPAAYFGPTYKIMSDVWKYVKNELFAADLVHSKSEQLKQIILKGGGVIDFWTLDDVNSGRGRKYGRVVIDEVAMIRHMDEAWLQTIRPTLTDYMGDAWLFSTPKGTGGRGRWWFKLFSEEKSIWTRFHQPTAKNPYISPEEIEQARATTPPLEFQQEYEAKFVNFIDTLFFNSWKEDLVLMGSDQLEIDPSEPLYISFDFNVDPMSALLFQVFDDMGIVFIDEVQHVGNTAQICDLLMPYRDHPSLLWVTGDYSGNRRSSASDIIGGEYVTDFKTIQEKLDLNPSQLIDTRIPNKKHTLSRLLCNWCMYNDIVYINERCRTLLSEIRTALPNNSGGLLKNRNEAKNDLVDAFRYGVHTQCRNDIDSLKKLKERVERNLEHEIL